MTTVDHRSVQITLILVVMLAAGFYSFKAAEHLRRLLRRSLRVISVLLIVASGALLLIDGCVQVTTDTQADAPIYSPDRTRAIVVRRWEAGPLGGSATYINLYSYGGLREDTVAGAEWFDEIAIRWVSDGAVELRSSPAGLYACKSTASVRVSCTGISPDHPDVK